MIQNTMYIKLEFILECYNNKKILLMEIVKLLTRIQVWNELCFCVYEIAVFALLFAHDNIFVYEFELAIKGRMNDVYCQKNINMAVTCDWKKKVQVSHAKEPLTTGRAVLLLTLN